MHSECQSVYIRDMQIIGSPAIAVCLPTAHTHSDRQRDALFSLTGALSTSTGNASLSADSLSATCPSTTSIKLAAPRKTTCLASGDRLQLGCSGPLVRSARWPLDGTSMFAHRPRRHVRCDGRLPADSRRACLRATDRCPSKRVVRHSARHWTKLERESVAGDGAALLVHGCRGEDDREKEREKGRMCTACSGRSIAATREQ